MSSAGDLFLRGLIDHPERLPKAPHNYTPQDSANRVDNGVFCVMCGGTADNAFIAQTTFEDTDTGNETITDTRWLDLCNGCTEWVVYGNNVEGYQDDDDESD